MEELKNSKHLTGIGIGFKKYEEAIGGFHSGVHIVGALLKTGKSFFAVNAAIYSAGIEKIPVLLLDTELDKAQGQWIRMLSRICEIDQDIIKYGRFKDDPQLNLRIQKAVKTLQSIPLDYLNINGKSFDSILSIIRKWLLLKVGYNTEGKLNKCLIVYDYIKLSDSSALRNATEWQLLGFRLEELHNICNQYSIPVLTFAQLNRDSDIAASHRLKWYATSYSSFHKKAHEEVAQDGIINGNRKLIIEDVRFAEGLEDGDYINFIFKGNIGRLIEGKTRNQLAQERQRDEVPVGEAEF